MLAECILELNFRLKYLIFLVLAHAVKLSTEPSQLLFRLQQHEGWKQQGSTLSVPNNYFLQQMEAVSECYLVLI